MELFGNPNIIAGLPLKRFRRVKLGDGGVLVLAESNEAGIGTVAYDDTDIGKTAAVRLFSDSGIHVMINGGGKIVPGNAAYAASDGKVSVNGDTLIGYVVASPSDISLDEDHVPVIPAFQSGGTGVPGIANYNSLNNKPSINDVELSGSMTGVDLKLASLSDLTQMQNDIETLKTELLGAAAVSDSLQNTIYGEGTP